MAVDGNIQELARKGVEAAGTCGDHALDPRGWEAASMAPRTSADG